LGANSAQLKKTNLVITTLEEIPVLIAVNVCVRHELDQITLALITLDDGQLPSGHTVLLPRHD
jgi:hypothetical protein